jgi:hypothetical protein
MFVSVLTGQATQREVAEKWKVDRSTVVHVCRVAKQGTLAERLRGGAGPGPVGDRAAAGHGQRAGRRVAPARGRSRLGLTVGPVPPRVSAEVKAGLLDLVGHAAEHGWAVRRATAALGLDHARYHHWVLRRDGGRLEDSPPGGIRCTGCWPGNAPRSSSCTRAGHTPIQEQASAGSMTGSEMLPIRIIVEVTKGREVEAGAGQEPFEQPGPVLHPLEPGLHQRGQLGKVGQGSFEMRPDQFDRAELVGVGRQLEHRQPVPGRDQLFHGGADMVFRLSQTTTSGPPSCWCQATA